jgi:hypothetical protein
MPRIAHDHVQTSNRGRVSIDRDPVTATRPTTLPNHKMIELAAKSGCGLKAIRLYVRGELRRASTINRVEEGLRACSLQDWLRPQDAPAKVIDEAMTRLPAHQLRQISAAAACDPSSVRKYVGGKPLRLHVVLRIEATLRTLGMESLIRQQDAAPPVVAPEGNNDALR